MEALAAGVPMVAIPITGDQFGVAARIVYSGVGKPVSLSRCDSDRVSVAIHCVLESESYRRRAADLRTAIGKTRGAARAAEIVEMVAETGRPVNRDSRLLPPKKPESKKEAQDQPACDHGQL